MLLASFHILSTTTTTTTASIQGTAHTYPPPSLLPAAQAERAAGNNPRPGPSSTPLSLFVRHVDV